MDHKDQIIAELRKQNEALQAEVLLLKQKILELETRLNRNSSNSNTPPSANGFNKPELKRKKVTHKKSGGQKGHAGKTLEMSAEVDETKKMPLECHNCQAELKDIPNIQEEVKQEVELEFRKKVVNYVVETKECPCCKTICSSKFPEHLKSRVQYGKNVKGLANYLIYQNTVSLQRCARTFKELFGLRISEGSLCNFSRKLAQQLGGFIGNAKDYLLQQGLLNFDETGININGKNNWLHTASHNQAVVYHAHFNRGSEGMDEGGIVNNFKGKGVHDGLKSYFKYDFEHVLCNAHHLRELFSLSQLK